MKDYTTGNTLTEVVNKALDDKLAKMLAEVKVETLVTLLIERKAQALLDTPPARLTDVKIENQRDSGSKIRRGFYQQIGSQAGHRVGQRVGQYTG